jgi:NADPH2:quinone reductase
VFSSGGGTPDLVDLAARVVKGELTVAVAGTYPLAEVAEAHRIVEAGHARGKLVLTVD